MKDLNKGPPPASSFISCSLGAGGVGRFGVGGKAAQCPQLGMAGGSTSWWDSKVPFLACARAQVFLHLGMTRGLLLALFSRCFRSSQITVLSLFCFISIKPKNHDVELPLGQFAKAPGGQGRRL